MDRVKGLFLLFRLYAR